ncbi:MAG: DMT family transporter [Melioribacter sp.]|nr:DMT family transporter [Melioribacter sp.]
MKNGMLGIVFSILAGLLMSIQGVFNTRCSEKIGLWETNIIVQITGFVFTLIILLIVGNGDFKKITQVNKLYLLGGVIGVLIIYSVMRGISDLGPTYSISTILVAQLITAAVIDFLGLFGAEKVSFHFTKIIGVILMISGIIVFKLKG